MRDASLYDSRFQASHTDRAPPRDVRRKGRPSLLSRIFGPKRMGATLILGIAAVAAIGVPLNALFFQDGRHPAPLFSAHISNSILEAPTPPSRPAVIEAARTERDASLPARPAPKDAIAEKIEKPEASKTLDPARGAAARTEAPRATDKKRDAIGSLIIGDASTPAASAHKADKTASADKPNAPVDTNVLYAQHALLRLGYVVRPDGILNSATRHALEKFERDVGLPGKGEITPSLLRQLAARSRLPRP